MTNLKTDMVKQKKQICKFLKRNEELEGKVHLLNS